MRAFAAILLGLLALPLADAGTQDPATYPPGVESVRNTPMQEGEDFEVLAEVTEAFDGVAVTVCRFDSLGAADPEVCFMNLPASQEGSTFQAGTGQAAHPDWKDGWVLGYKLTLMQGESELHAPTSGDYYRVVVGSEADAEGLVEVGDFEEEAEETQAPERGSPLPISVALAALAAAAIARRRR